MNWILIEIMVFFFNFLSLIVFMMITRTKKYLTFRERIGLAFESGPLCRKEADYLEYCSQDIRYFSSTFTALCLVYYAGYYNARAYDSHEIDISFGICFTRHCCFAYLFGKFFFNRKFNPVLKFLDMITVCYLFVTNFLLIVLYCYWHLG